MKDEMKTMQVFLVTAQSMKKKKKALLKVWVEQVKSLSYDIEDYLDEFIVHVGTSGTSLRPWGGGCVSSGIFLANY
jgi:hypothetical protein